jgi:glyoxylase-like metal-dependent hydrolase (beta-lactamase superfamily II)
MLYFNLPVLARSKLEVKTTKIVALLCLCSVPGLVSGHDVPATPDVVSIPQVLDAFGWDFDKAEITVEEVEEGFYVLFGLGGNIAVSSGEDGVLIVDDQFPELMPRIKRAMRRVGDKQVDFVINTHWHFDHAAGNKVLGKDGAWLVSHSNSRRMMLRDNVINLVTVAGLQESYPEHALPDITFNEHMQFHINGEEIDLLHFGPAHTTGDTMVYFHGRNAVHMGDVFNTAGYPFIDAGNGGTIDGVINTCKAVLALIDEETVVIPGHGSLAARIDLQNYIYMLEVVQGELKAMIAAGNTLAEIQAANITSTWDEKLGDPALFINRSYVSLTTRYTE